MNTVITDTLKNLKDQGIDLNRVKAIEYEEKPYESDDVFQVLKKFKIELINEPVTTEGINPSSLICKCGVSLHLSCRRENCELYTKIDKLTNEQPKEYNPSCLTCKTCKNFCTLHGDKISKG